MARVPSDLPLVPSVLDRLMDFEPTAAREAPKSRSQVLRELKLSVRRDLENLLNTRQRFGILPEGLKELERSLVRYGLPDITGSDLGTTRSREELRRTLERVIQNFEPRFKSVSVAVLDEAETLDRTLRFRIQGLLRRSPHPSPWPLTRRWSRRREAWKSGGRGDERRIVALLQSGVELHPAHGGGIRRGPSEDCRPAAAEGR